jgi:class 3 adenylate cyclase
MRQIADWLETLGMSEYTQRFAENRIDFSVLPDLTDQDLKDLGVVLGDRRKILRAIAKLDAPPEAVTLTPKPAITLPVTTEQPVAISEQARERHHFTVMFCELVDSADIPTKLDTEEWRDLVEAYLDAASAVATEMGGKIAETRADGLIALFGYPAAQENDSERAVRAALATQRAVAELNRMNADTSRPALAAYIVIDSGPVVIDAVGEIVGDTPNILRQAQTLGEPGAVQVTARVQQQVAGLFVAHERGSRQLKGVPEAVTLYGIVEASGCGNLRTDYHQLIAKAVEGLDRSTREARRALYERARKALVAQMRSAQPALLKPNIVKERLALEDAIRKVEAEAARKSPTETLAASQAAGAPDGGTQVVSRELRRDGADRPPADLPSAGRPPVLPDARERLLNGRSSLAKQAVKGFRDVIREVRAASVSDGGTQAASGRSRRDRANPAPANLPGAGLPAVLPDDRKRLLHGRSLSEKQGVKGFRDVVHERHNPGLVAGKGAKAERQTSEAYELEAPQYLPNEDPTASSQKLEPHLDLQDSNWDEYDMRHERDLEPAYEPEHEQPLALPQGRYPSRRAAPVRHTQRHAAPEGEYERRAAALSYGGLARLLMALIILAGMVAVISWQRSAVTEFYYFLRRSEWKPQTTSHETRPTQPKFSGRVPQEQGSGQAPGTAAPSVPPNGG